VEEKKKHEGKEERRRKKRAGVRIVTTALLAYEGANIRF
jgi:hypothetical protein